MAEAKKKKPRNRKNLTRMANLKKKAAFKAFREPFLQMLRELPYVKLACQKLSYPLSSAYYRRTHDKKFAEEWDEAIKIGMDSTIKGELYRRGVLGVKRPCVSAGVHVTDEIVYSDQCLLALARAHDPAFRDTRVNMHVGKDGGPIQTLDLNKIIEEKEKELIALGGDPVAIKRGLIESLVSATAGGGDPPQAEGK